MAQSETIYLHILAGFASSAAKKYLQNFQEVRRVFEYSCPHVLAEYGLDSAGQWVPGVTRFEGKMALIWVPILVEMVGFCGYFLELRMAPGATAKENQCGFFCGLIFGCRGPNR